jgi:hypothetical protein
VTRCATILPQTAISDLRREKRKGERIERGHTVIVHWGWSEKEAIKPEFQGFFRVWPILDVIDILLECIAESGQAFIYPAWLIRCYRSGSVSELNVRLLTLLQLDF